MNQILDLLLESLGGLVFLLLIGGVLLWLGAEWLVKASSSLAGKLGISQMMIGATVVAFGTSAPEWFVSLRAQMQGFGGLALGNIIGSNVANLGLALGLTALVRPVKFPPILLRRELPLVLAAEILFWWLVLDLELSRYDGLALMAGFAALYLYLLRASALGPRAGDHPGECSRGEPFLKDIVVVVVGLLGLAAGSEVFMRGAEGIARRFGVARMIIGLTVVAIGTSLPEVITSVVAALRHRYELSLGNLLGSNFFNVLFVGGTMTVVRPVDMHPEHLPYVYWMIGITVLLLPLAWIAPRKRSFGRIAGAVLLITYLSFLFETVRSS
ncbi:MAG: calcium/sodium antiporter [Planctomycetota bacterium]